MGVSLLLFTAAPEAKVPVTPKQQAAVDAALMQVKTGDEKTRKRAYAALWKLGVRVPLPEFVPFARNNAAPPEPATRPVPLQGPGALACSTPLWAKQELLHDESNDGSSTEARGVKFARSEQALAESEDFLESVVDAPAAPSSGPFIVTFLRLERMGMRCTAGEGAPVTTGMGLGLTSHPAGRALLRRCCKGDAKCLTQSTREESCFSDVLSAASGAREKYESQAPKLYEERLMDCLPAGDRVKSRLQDEATDTPRSRRAHACALKIGRESLARGTARWDLEAAIWIQASSAACAAGNVRTSCTPIVVDPCRGRVGYHCSDESIRELQVPHDGVQGG
ncbi:hypothetical protein D7V88_00560 [Corallococcus terminator]|uniref:Uncharacterized protein n=1 Tax=Corallococcus terminator TaxID=2316733 RepID=A0A3A8JGG2_9BACT|nr:hypothetical protein D7V88_00560 [Corallococcus terminator]